VFPRSLCSHALPRAPVESTSPIPDLEMPKAWGGGGEAEIYPVTEGTAAANFRTNDKSTPKFSAPSVLYLCVDRSRGGVE
jgi:hypothetical protein